MEVDGPGRGASLARSPQHNMITGDSPERLLAACSLRTRRMAGSQLMTRMLLRTDCRSTRRCRDTAKPRMRR